MSPKINRYRMQPCVHPYGPDNPENPAMLCPMLPTPHIPLEYPWNTPGVNTVAAMYTATESQPNP